MNYKGTVKAIMEAQRFSEKFVKREFVVSDTTEKYPQLLIFEVQNNNCSILDGIKEGDDVSVVFQIRGREWKNPEGKVKYFLTLVASDVSLVKSAVTQKQNNDPASAPVVEDDLPF